MSSKIEVSDRCMLMRAKSPRHEVLWRRISLDYPELDPSALDDWSFVNFLRRWVYQNVRREARMPGEATAGFLDNDSNFAFYSKDAPDIFEAFGTDLGGVIGGGCCWSMQTMLEAFDYQAVIIDCGQRGGQFTRISVLCEIFHDGDFLWVVLDPNYDFSIVSAAGAPISYFNLLAHLARGEDDKVAFEEGDPDSYRLIITYPNQQGKLGYDWTIRDENSPVRRLADGRVIYKAHMSWQAYQRNAQGARAYLMDLGFKPNLIYFFTQVFGVYPPHSPHRQMVWKRIGHVFSDIGPLID